MIAPCCESLCLRLVSKLPRVCNAWLLVQRVQRAASTAQVQGGTKRGRSISACAGRWQHSPLAAARMSLGRLLKPPRLLTRMVLPRLVLQRLGLVTLLVLESPLV